MLSNRQNPSGPVETSVAITPSSLHHLRLCSQLSCPEGDIWAHLMKLWANRRKWMDTWDRQGVWEEGQGGETGKKRIQHWIQNQVTRPAKSVRLDNPVTLWSFNTFDASPRFPSSLPPSAAASHILVSHCRHLKAGKFGRNHDYYF